MFSSSYVVRVGKLGIHRACHHRSVPSFRAVGVTGLPQGWAVGARLALDLRHSIPRHEKERAACSTHAQHRDSLHCKAPCPPHVPLCTCACLCLCACLIRAVCVSLVTSFIHSFSSFTQHARNAHSEARVTAHTVHTSLFSTSSLALSLLPARAPVRCRHVRW